jgi:hypothetical protein
MDWLHFGWFLLVNPLLDDIILWAYDCEHELVNMMEVFKHLLMTSTKYAKNIFHYIEHNLWWCGKIFYHVQMNENLDEKTWKMLFVGQV